MKEIKNILGQTFGKFKVIEIAITKNKKTRWKCLCDCGQYRVVYATNLIRGLTQSCGCSRKTINNPQKISTAHLSALRALFNSYRNSAKKKNHKFDLTIEECHRLFLMDCTYCGSPPISEINTYLNKKGLPNRKALSNVNPQDLVIFSFNYNGIDRIDNLSGYSITNTTTCCKYCNFAKHTLSLHMWNEWVSNLVKFNSKNSLDRNYLLDEIVISYVDNPTVRNLIYDYKRKAKKRQLPFELTNQDCFKLFKGNCYYCGALPSNTINYYLKKDGNVKNFAEKRNFRRNVTELAFVYNGIDRVDPLLGYLKNSNSFIQTVPCCKICNCAKLNRKYNEWKNWILRISNFQTRKNNGDEK